MTIEDLRKNAELYLCSDCFKKYKIQIEPNIMSYLSQPLFDYRQVESQITQIVMKHKGIFKGDFIVLSIDKEDEEKAADEVDVTAFRKVERMGFLDKIKYLHNNGILQDSSYKILDMARDTRNKIHNEPIVSEFSIDDYLLFSMARSISYNIWSAMMVDWNMEMKDKIITSTEKAAELWLKRLRNVSYEKD